MEERKRIIVKDENYILKELYTDSDGDTVWDIEDPKKQNNFVVHSSASGKLYITFFKRLNITDKCSLNAIKKICEILLERGLNPTINIYYKNTSLIALCKKIGFRKTKNVKREYYLKNLK